MITLGVGLSECITSYSSAFGPSWDAQSLRFVRPLARALFPRVIFKRACRKSVLNLHLESSALNSSEVCLFLVPQ